jgi:endonuclease III
VLDELVFSMLLWEATTSQAKAAFKRLRDSFVDLNDVRVAMDEEIAASIGERYPLSRERARRIRAALNDVYRRFHAVSLASARELSKRDAKALLVSLEGVPLFASHRVLLVELGIHAIAVDERLREMLMEEGVLDEANDVSSATAFLERHIASDDALCVAGLLQEWADQQSGSPKKERKSEPANKPARKSESKPPKTDAPKRSKARPKGSS